ncbi:hypothetical protein E6H28_05965 [Candidatus Bathyarchaeota archaeon]|nr:MAG: hypothetical protein E6H28_05965 [Candidatus Bathyarchaeota archaeon]
MFHQRARTFLLFLMVSLILVTAISVPVRAPAGETYSLSASPSRIQEGSTTTLSLAVTNASLFTNYNFAWKVTDPSGANSTLAKTTNSGFGANFVQTVNYPQDLSAGTAKYVGTYTVRVNETTPANKPNVATITFQVGLTDANTYQRTSKASIQASSYLPGERITVNIAQGSISIPGFPAQGTADATGIFTYTWQSAPSTSTGSYIISLRGMTTTKMPPDTETIILFPANITISQAALTRTSIPRSEREELRITANYQSSVSVQSGTLPVTFVEADSTTFHAVNAIYNSTLNLFFATYRIPLSGQAGSWAVRIDPNTFSDGYGNGGPGQGTTIAFTVQQAVLAVSVSLVNKTYTSGDVFPIYATVLSPDGTPFGAGTVTATVDLSSTGEPIGSPISLSYVQGQGRWVGSNLLNSTDKAGIWIVDVKASDSYGNSGEGGGALLVNIGPAPGGSQSVSLLYFVLAAVLVGAGATGGLLFMRFNKMDAPFSELSKLMGGEFQPPTTLMIRGESGSGTTMIGLELIYQQLMQGKHCKFLDCYSALVGEQALIKDPVDFTEVSIQVSLMMSSAQEPVTVLLDSFTPIFNSAQTRHGINFLRVLGAKIKNDGGFFILTGTRGSLPDPIESNLESIVDGIIDLKLVRKGKSMIRTLAVRKVAGRQIDFAETEFKIIRGKGVMFVEPRFQVGLPAITRTLDSAIRQARSSLKTLEKELERRWRTEPDAEQTPEPDGELN